MKDESKPPIDISCLARIIQIMNILSILGLIGTAIARFTKFGAGEEAPTDPFFYLLTIYLIPFSLLLLCAEMHWTIVLKYVQFLGYQYGKGLFFVFIALLLFDTDSPWDSLVSVVVSLVGFFNLLTACFVPGYNHLTFLRPIKEKNSDDEYDSE